MIVIKHRKSPDVVLLRVNSSGLDDRDLTGAYLLGAGMTGIRGHRVILRDANLRNADLRASDLCGADLRGALLRGADLQGADLQDALFAAADLRGADLHGADLRGADLRDAILAEARLDGIRCDDRTRWPAESAWAVSLASEANYGVVVDRAPVQEAKTEVWQPTAAMLKGASGLIPLNLRTPWLARRAAQLVGGVLAVTLAVAALVGFPSIRGVRSAQRVEPWTVSQSVPPADTQVEVPSPAPSRNSFQMQAKAQPAQKLRRLATNETGAGQVRKSKPEKVAGAPRSRVAGTRSSQFEPVRQPAARPVQPQLLASAEPVRPRKASPAPVRKSTQELSVPLPYNRASEAEPTARVEPPAVVATLPTPKDEVAPSQIQDVAATSKRGSKSSSDRRRWAWGNSEFHYGSGYDIYSMHQDRNRD